MRCLLIYEIAHDGTRTTVSDACLDYGLECIQFSAFMGEVSWVHQKELLLKKKRRIGSHDAKCNYFLLTRKAGQVTV